MALAALLVGAAAAQDLGNANWHAPRAGDYVGEAGGALVVGALVGAGAWLALGIAGMTITGENATPWIDMNVGFAVGSICGIVLGYPFGCALGTTTVGSWMKCEGNISGAYSGAYLGLLAAIPCIGLPAPLFVPAGAVIGYNRGAKRAGHPSSFGARVTPPAVAFSLHSDREQQRSLGLDCLLVTVRF